MKPSCVEIFCGGGLSALGIESAGYRILGAYDINRQAVTMYNNCDLLAPVANRCDLATIDWEEERSRFMRMYQGLLGERIDLLAGGPVCKAFSPGGTVFGTEGAADERNTWPLAIRALAALKPRYALFENSFGMGRKKFEGYIAQLRTEFSKLGYSCSIEQIDCIDYGVPQHRKRIIFRLSEFNAKYVWTPPRIGAFAKGVLMHLMMEAGLPYRSTISDILYAGPLMSATGEPMLKPLSAKALAYYLQEDAKGVQVHVKKHPPLLGGRPASTVVSVYKKGVPYGVFKQGVQPGGKPLYYHVQPRLAACLQGLPDGFYLSGSKTALLEAIGNGFPPQASFAICHHLRGAMISHGVGA